MSHQQGVSTKPARRNFIDHEVDLHFARRDRVDHACSERRLPQVDEKNYEMPQVE
ncbi:hypothetical protein ABT352_39010 [Streptosporangium sp. NPDC000563]|uniref:hypothetical protein n=1 Tax=Streptosporangium sp. NPDC000563 TaxID=3154366 RepID=UPI00332E52E3